MILKRSMQPRRLCIARAIAGEPEVILLDDGETEEAARYTGSVRVIYPVEGTAVKFYGECELQDEVQ